jgi:hypothetical protein
MLRRPRYLILTAAGALGAAYIAHRLLDQRDDNLKQHGVLTMEALWAERPQGVAATPAKIHDVAANGNCMFLAVATAMAYADEGKTLERGDKTADRQAAELRRLANDKLCPGGAPSHAITEEGLPVSMVMEPLRGENGMGYCRRMRRDGQWGTAAELWALSQELARPIHVWKRGEQKPIASYGQDKSGPPLAVCYVNDSHYMAVLGTGMPKSRL